MGETDVASGVNDRWDHGPLGKNAKRPSLGRSGWDSNSRPSEAIRGARPLGRLAFVMETGHGGLLRRDLRHVSFSEERHALLLAY